MHILFVFLKIIGIILLVVLGLILLALLILLFVPLRYEAVFERRPEEDNSFVQAQVRITWLLRLIGITAQADASGWGAALRIGPKVIRSFGNAEKTSKEAGTKKKKPRRDKPRRDKPRKDEPRKDRPVGAETLKKTDPDPERRSPEQSNPTPVKEAVSKVQPAAADRPAFGGPRIEQHKESAAPSKDPHEKRSSLTEHLESIRKRILEIGRGLLMQLEKLPERMEHLQEELEELPDRWESFLQRVEAARKKWEPYLSDRSRQWYGRVWKRLKCVLHSARVRDISGELTLGSGSPDTTALLYGLIYAYLPVKEERFVCMPDFYETRLEGRVRLKGHIRMNHLVFAVVVLLFDKETRIMIHRIRSH